MCGVALVAVLSPSSETTFARPKSSSFACPRLVTKILAGLMSRPDDVFAVSRVERVCDLDALVEQGLCVQRAPFDLALEGDTLEKLHGDERLPILLADVVDGADIGVVQRRSCLRFALKPRQRLTVSCYFVGQKL